MFQVLSDLVNASASTLQDDDLQQLGGVTLCIFPGVYGQHLQRVKKTMMVDQSGFSGNTVKSWLPDMRSLTFLHML